MSEFPKAQGEFVARLEATREQAGQGREERNDGISLESRLAGGVWGHLIGDALGVPYEFKSAAEIGEVVWGKRGTHHQLAGTWSDDGGLMLALLDSLLSQGFDLEDQGQRALRWWRGPEYKPGELFDIGNTTSKALARLEAGWAAHLAGGEGERDQGNGSLMRILPVALVGHALSPMEVAKQAMMASTVTHRGGRAPLVCAMYCLIAHGLLQGVELSEAKAGAQRVTRELARGKETEALEEILGYKERNGSGYVVDSFWSALDALEESGNYRQTIERAIAYGNDTDTTACVAGGLAGIRWGMQGIPEEWVSAMRGHKIVEEMVARLLVSP